MENRCCNAAGSEFCTCDQDRWVSVSDRLPRDGVAVLWFDPSDKVWPVVLAKLDNGRLDWGGDLTASIKGMKYWAAIPELPVPGSAKKP
jgi:hypothetical protein